jgi:hypothetical protein
MKLVVRKQIPDRIEVDLHPDELDSLPFLKCVRFHGPGVARISNTRMALLSYLLSRHLISNLLDVEGCAFPSFVATSCSRDFRGDELFVQAVSNTPEKLAIDRRIDAIHVGGGAPPAKCISVVEDTLGFRMVRDNDSTDLVASNVGLHFTGVQSGELLSRLSVAVAVCEAHGADTIKVQPGPWGLQVGEATRLRKLFADAGLMLEVIEEGERK